MAYGCRAKCRASECSSDIAKEDIKLMRSSVQQFGEWWKADSFLGQFFSACGLFLFCVFAEDLS
jgi:hypothetical protein